MLKNLTKILLILSLVFVGATSVYASNHNTGTIGAGDYGAEFENNAAFGGGGSGTFTGGNSSSGSNSLGSIFGKSFGLLDALIKLIMGLAVVVFLWGVFSYVIAPGPDGKDKAKGYILWGIIGLFVMVSVWGIVTIMTETLFGEKSPTNTPPTIPSVRGN